MAKQRQNSESFDSGRQYLSNVYAKALLGVTEGAGKTASVLAEFDSFVTDVLDKLPQFEALLASPRLAHEEKSRMLDKALQSKMSLSLLNFLKVVARHGRLDCIRTINKSAHRLYDELQGRIVVHIRTAEAVGNDVINSIMAKLKQKLGKELELKTTIDPDILGGLVVKIGDTVFDGSVAHQLQRFREEALRNTQNQLRGALDRFVAAS